MHPAPTFRRDAAIILLLLLLAYAYVLPRWADWSQNSRLNLTRAMVELGTVRIDAYVQNTGDYALYEGHAYTDKAPGPSLMAVPIYALALPVIDHPAVSARLERVAGGGAMGGTLNPEGSGLNSEKVRAFMAQVLLTLSVVALPSALAAIVLYRLLLELGPALRLKATGNRQTSEGLPATDPAGKPLSGQSSGPAPARGLSLLITLGYGLATPALAYAGNFYSHQLAGSLCLVAFALLYWMAQGRGGRARALLVGLLLGFAVISEYPIAIVAGALGLYAIVKLRPALVALIIVGGMLPVLLMVVYDLVAFGTPLPIGYSHSALWQDQHHTGFMSISYPTAEALWGLTFGTFRGLFVRAPWLLLCVPGVILWWRGGVLRAELVALLGGAVGLILFYASSIMWWGGFGVGPRYIVPAIPLLALVAYPALAWLWGRAWGRALSLGLVIVSFGATWAESVAGQSFPHDSVRETWTGYVFPAWAAGDIARNAGNVLGLSGPLSLLPLALALGLFLALLLLPGRVRPAVEQPAQTKVPVA